MAELELAFGKHIRSLRRARGLTQTGLAEAAGVSVDTVRRLEHGHFSASLGTLAKLAAGLRLSLGALFAAFEAGADAGVEAELAAVLRGLPPASRLVALQIVSTLARADVV